MIYLAVFNESAETAKDAAAVSRAVFAGISRTMALPVVDEILKPSAHGLHRSRRAEHVLRT